MEHNTNILQFFGRSRLAGKSRELAEGMGINFMWFSAKFVESFFRPPICSGMQMELKSALPAC